MWGRGSNSAYPSPTPRLSGEGCPSPRGKPSAARMARRLSPGSPLLFTLAPGKEVTPTWAETPAYHRRLPERHAHPCHSASAGAAGLSVTGTANLNPTFSFLSPSIESFRCPIKTSLSREIKRARLRLQMPRHSPGCTLKMAVILKKYIFETVPTD